jgi:hypothetical protein
VPRDLPDLRIEPGPGGYFLFLGEEKICVYSVRAAAEQVIDSWRARRANGETDDQIRAASGHRPTKPTPGPPMAAIGAPAASAAAVIALRAEIEALRVKRDHTDISRKGGLKRQATRHEDDEPEWVARAIDVAQKARETDPTISRSDIIRQRIMVRLEGMPGLPGFRQLMRHMAHWEAVGPVPRKVTITMSPALPRGKRKTKL